MAHVDDIELGSWRANADNTFWLLFSLVAVVIPHMLRFPLWVSVVFAALVVWRWLSVSYGRWSPGRWLMVLVAVGAFVAIGLQFRSLIGRDAGVALLALLAGLKLLETRTARDAYVTLMLTFFLVVTNFLYSQSIATGIYMLAVTIVTTTALVSLQHSNREIGPRERLRIARNHFAQALPLMLVAFVLFPRLPGPLWSLPKDVNAGVTGLSESMAPGQISSLSQSNAVAFRVKFAGPRPRPQDMYWRGPVLDQSDGVRWTRGSPRLPVLPQFLTQRVGKPVDYVVTLEPSAQRWLFALEMPATSVADASTNSAGEILTRHPINELRQYSARSYMQFLFRQTTNPELRLAQQLPLGYHPKARALAAKWRSEIVDQAAIVERALDYLREQQFAYTLRPPLLKDDPVDEFLFQSRRGFCEHFASAFVILMRAAGIPARVVTGYQGGEENKVGEYWIVRQRDAHAWAEVWLSDRGWSRVDPTAAVAPTRINSGVDAALPATSADTVFGMQAASQALGWWRQLRHSWDAINNGWNQWVLGYGRDVQRDFLAQFGLDTKSWRDVGVAFLTIMAATLACIALWIWRRREPIDAVVRAYLRFCVRLAAAGVERGANEPASVFAARASAALPARSSQIAEVTRAYESARYGRASKASRAEFVRLARQFRA